MQTNAFDTLIMTTPSDFERLKRLYPRIPDNLPGRRLVFIGSTEVVRLVGEAGFDSRITALDENEILPFDDVHACMTKHMADLLAGRDLPRGVTGWYYQQFLKFAYAEHCTDSYYMIWDGDTIPCRPVSMFSEDTGIPLLDLKHEYHREYFDTIKALFPGTEKAIAQSFISEHMLFRKELMLELIGAIEANDALPGTLFWEKIIHAIPAGRIQDSAFSEFETYGTFVVLKHPSAYRLREWHSFRLGGEFFDPDTISDRDFKWLGIDFDAISFEKGMSVREDHKNLFDNPEYQEKLSPRQMLEIAQQEFKEGYLEVWDDEPAANSANRSVGAFQTENRNEGIPLPPETDMEQRLEQIRLAYRQGEQLYAALREKRPEETDIIISPKHIGDTIWLCAFAKAYKEEHDCKRVMMVVPESQKELVSFFPSVDLSLPMNKANITALRIYIGINELWKQPHIIYAHFPVNVTLTKNGVQLREIIETRSMLTMNRQFMDLGPGAMPERMAMPSTPLSEENQERYRNAVMLMPGVHSLDSLPKSFWEKLANRLSTCGLCVVTNYNGVDCEYVVDGTEALGSTFSEMVAFSSCFKAFIGARSGICDLLAGTNAKLVCIWETWEEGTGINIHPVQKEFADPAILGRSEGIWNFQYQKELEDELLDQIIRCIQ